jgi:PAS domain S-box-containing protein
LQPYRTTELRPSEERLRLVIDSVQDYAIYTLDVEGRVTTWNSGAARIKGYTASEIIEKNFSILYPTEQEGGHSRSSVSYRDG